MAINLTTVFRQYTDEQFSTESKKALLTNNDFNWTGAHTVKVYKISTAAMNDYDRAGTGTGATGSRYGALASLNATTEEFTLTKDRSFTFAIDKLDTDETAQQLAGVGIVGRDGIYVVELLFFGHERLLLPTRPCPGPVRSPSPGPPRWRA